MSKPAYTLKAYGETYNLHTNISHYSDNGNLAICIDAENEGPFATLTVNIDPLPAPLAAVDTNNCSWAEEFIEKYELGTFTGMTLRSGFCTYPVYKFDLDKLLVTGENLDE
jgi:hypothetical protein